jgi:translation initiation factor eIF-2B subunit gamma
MNNVQLGDNVVLQNTIVGVGAVIGDNCSLNDCQVAAGMNVVSGTKEKGEVLIDTAAVG